MRQNSNRGFSADNDNTREPEAAFREPVPGLFDDRGVRRA
jgi:hypothetical protein